MMEFLEFTFRSFWHFVGVIVLITAIGSLIPTININRKSKGKDE
jgi:hypothetical protein